MEAKHTPLCRSLILPQQYRVPIYQRKYSWRKDECEKLLNDIIQAGEKNDAKYYFIGSLVHVSVPVNPGEIPKYIVIDGQQRITTILLILIALRKALDESPEQKKIKNKICDYIVNRHESGEKRYKLMLTPNDKNTMQSIIDDGDYPNECSIVLKNNFEYIKKYIENVDLVQIYNGLEKLVVVNIILEKKDRPQLIFESINSTGRQLTKTDLIRNYILMDLSIEEQEKIYNKYWRPMEKDFDDYQVFDEFMKDFLTIKNKDVIKIEKIYEQFKKWRSEQKVDIEEIARDVKDHSELFAKMMFDRKEDDLELRKIIANINKLKTSVMRPFLLKIMIFHQQGKITRDERRGVFLMVESYTFRRAVCGMQAAGLNKLVPQFISQLDKITTDHFDGIKAILFAQKKRYRFPDDIEFKNKFKSIEMYNTKIARYALFRLENFLRSGDKNHTWLEDDSNDKISIEHIMPKNISAWKGYLSDAEMVEAEEYIHTIGNLTLTGYNSELSDKLFLEKVNMDGGFKSSPFLLNTYVKDCTGWKKEQIDNRASNLAENAVTMWERIEPSVDTLKKYTDNILQSFSEDYTEEDYLNGEFTPNEIPQSTRDLFDDARDTISKEFKELEYKPKKLYCGFYIQEHAVCSIRVLKNSLKLFYNVRDEILPKTSFVEHLINEDGTIKGHWGTGNYVSEIKNITDIEEAISLIRKTLESITNT